MNPNMSRTIPELQAELQGFELEVANLRARLHAASGALEFIETAARNSKRLDSTVIALYAADVRRALSA